MLTSPNSIFQNRINYDTLEKIRGEFFRDQKVVQISETLEGMTSDRESRTYTLGTWAGPEANVSNLLHEMGHFAEREISKLKEFPFSSWGYRFGTPWSIMGQSGYEMSTDQSLRREQRVWAYQIPLEKHFGCHESSYDTVCSVKYLSAWVFYQPFANKVYQDEVRIQEFSRETDIMSNQNFTYEKFCEEWWKRIRVIQTQKETPNVR